MKNLLTLITFIFLVKLSPAQNVGIGTAAPGFPLNFSSTIGDKISLYGNSGNHYGFGIQGGLLQMHSDAAAANIAFGYGSSTSFTERMRIINSGTEGMLLKGRLSLQNGTSPLDVSQTPGIWLYKANNTGPLAFIGTYDNQNVGFYGGPVGWGFTYDAINSRIGINTSVTLNGNAGNYGQVLQSNGTGAVPTWTGKPYVLYFNQTGYTDFYNAPGVLSRSIPGLDGNTFTLTQNSRIVFNTTLHTGSAELIATSRYFSDVQIVNAGGTVVERATCHVLLSGGFEDINANSVGIGILPAGTYTIRAFLRRAHDTDGQAWCDKGAINPASLDYRGGQMIIEIFPE